MRLTRQFAIRVAYRRNAVSKITAVFFALRTGQLFRHDQPEFRFWMHAGQPLNLRRISAGKRTIRSQKNQYQYVRNHGLPSVTVIAWFAATAVRLSICPLGQ